MSQLVYYAYYKEYSNFISKILSSVPDYDVEGLGLNRIRWEKPVSLINGCGFVVNYINLFITNVKDKGFNINQGSSKWRGKVNSMTSFLSIIDKEYRNNLYYNNLYNVQSETFKWRSKLPRSKFSFRNIHMNLGSVKW